MSKQFDFVVIGGGIFGIYAALYLTQKGQHVCLIEKEKELLKKASIVNQARLHSGYHYPRSVATAIMSDDNKDRFTHDHRDFINFAFDKYYAIDRYSSLTNSQQFERFCNFIKIKCKPVLQHSLFNFNRIEALFATEEYSFDPILIANYYENRLKNQKNISIYKECRITQVEVSNDQYHLTIQQGASSQNFQVRTAQVINATYSGSNSINQLFGVTNINLMHEISEIAFVTAPKLEKIGLTIMDGQFGSIMPYGLSGLLSLSSVAYTHHKVSYDDLPTFSCQSQQPDCQPAFTSICNYCTQKPRSNYKKMIGQIKQYFQPEIDLQYFHSYYTIKSKLKANYIDDGRPTEIRILNENPRFYCIFAGKINSIYEIEKIVEY